MTTATTTNLNGIDVDALKEVVETIRQDPSQGLITFHVNTAWKGGTVTETRVKDITLGDAKLPRDFSIRIDEPPELLGTNTAANPQEYLFAAMNACMAATYVAACAAQGVTLESLEIETSGELDLRGFLGIDGNVKSGYDSIRYTIRVKGDGTEKQYNDVHAWMKKTSPNYFNMANAIQLNSQLVVE